MRTIIRITKSELRVLFFSPIAWLILIVFSFQVGMAYCDVLAQQLQSMELGYHLRLHLLCLPVTREYFQGYWIIYIFTFLCLPWD